MEKAFVFVCEMLLLVFVLERFRVVNGGKVKLFVLGDSLVDCGTNNYLNTSKLHRANYYPYGRNAFSGNPTGRFSDGKVTPDFIAELAGLPLIPSYLQPHADHSYGANFASGGAGVLPDTNKGEVVNMDMQIQQLIELREKLGIKLGHLGASQVFSDAVYQVSFGVNDYKVFSNNYEAQLYQDKDEYVRLVIGKLTLQIQVLYKYGARKFLFPLLKNLGCSPGMRVLGGGECFELATYLCATHNTLLEEVLISMASKLEGFKYIVFDQFEFMKARIQNPQKYGFVDGHNACCGTGLLRGLNTCGGKKGATNYQLCPDSTSHIFFDSYHCTESINRQAAHTMWEGKDPSVRPLPLKTFFNSNSEVSHVDIGRKGEIKVSLTMGHASSK